MPTDGVNVSTSASNRTNRCVSGIHESATAQAAQNHICPRQHHASNIYISVLYTPSAPATRIKFPDAANSPAVNSHKLEDASVRRPLSSDGSSCSQSQPHRLNTFTRPTEVYKQLNRCAECFSAPCRRYSKRLKITRRSPWYQSYLLHSPTPPHSSLPFSPEKKCP